jgi:hypothetical protein
MTDNIHFGFSFSDSTGDHESLILSMDNEEVPTWYEVLAQFLDFLSTVYGYSIQEQLLALDRSGQSSLLSLGQPGA